MTDKYLVCMGGFITIIYTVYMMANPHTDGIVLSTVIGAMCLLAGVHYQKTKNAYAFSMEEPEDVTNADQEQCS